MKSNNMHNKVVRLLTAATVIYATANLVVHACFQYQHGTECTTGRDELSRIENGCRDVSYSPKHSLFCPELYIDAGKTHCAMLAMSAMKTVTKYRIVDNGCGLEIEYTYNVPTGEICQQALLYGDDCSIGGD